MYDVFLSHANEDKDEIARPLAKALKERGIKVFFDEDVIIVGDNLRRVIDEGLRESKNGVFIFSPNFFKKIWPQKELDVFFAREINGEKSIIPVWHNLTFEDMLREAPTIATQKAIKTTGKTIDEIAVQIIEAIRQRRGDPNIGKISEKIIRIEANRDSIIIRNPISFNGTCINCEGNVHLTLYGPGKLSSGKEIATVAPTEKNTWSFTLPSDYVVQPGNYSMEVSDSQKKVRNEVTFKAVKGSITVVAAGDQHYYIGEKIRLSGTSLAGKEVYLTLKGVNPKIKDSKLDQLDILSISGNAQSFVKVSVGYDNCWSYIWDTSKIGSKLEKGQYTIYALEAPVSSKDISEESYGTVSIIIEKPFVSATVTQSAISKGENAFITGTAEGRPNHIQIWIFGESYSDVQKAQVNPDASFKFELPKKLTRKLPSGQYFVVVQHPMMNNTLDVYLGDNGQDVLTYSPKGETLLFSIQGPRKITGAKAAMALVSAINNPLIDDTYTKLQFLITDSKSDTSDEDYQEPVNVIRIEKIDNSVIYETDKQDFWLFELIAPYLIKKFGKTKILAVGIFSIMIGLVSMIAPTYKISIPYLFWIGASFLFIGVIFIAVVKYHSHTQCKKCKQEFAYEEIGTPQVKEVTTSDGYIKKTITRKYKCKFCGDVDTRKSNETIPPQSDSE